MDINVDINYGGVNHMEFNSMDEQLKEAILTAQKNEITEYHIYLKLSEMIKDQNNKKYWKELVWKNLLTTGYGKV